MSLKQTHLLLSLFLDSFQASQPRSTSSGWLLAAVLPLLLPDCSSMIRERLKDAYQPHSFYSQHDWMQLYFPHHEEGFPWEMSKRPNHIATLANTPPALCWTDSCDTSSSASSCTLMVVIFQYLRKQKQQIHFHLQFHLCQPALLQPACSALSTNSWG